MLSSGVSLLILAWILVSISTVIVSLRFLARWIRLGRLEIDDYCMSMALVIELVHTSLLTVAEHFGLGRHIWNLSKSDQIQAMKYITIQEGVAIGSPTFGRISFAIFLIMLLGPTAWVKRYILWFLVGSQIIVNIATIIQVYTQCGTHPSALWDPAVKAIAHCQSPEVETYFGYVQSGFNSSTDLVLTILPSLIIWDLNLPRKAKIGLSMVLGLSLFALAASIAKAVEIKNLAYRNDFTYNMAALQICTVIENNVVMIAASIPKLRPLWKKQPTLELSWGSRTPFTADSLPGQQAASLSRSSRSSRHETRSLEEGEKDDEDQEDHEYKFGENDEGGITKTVDVEIAYRNGSASSASTGEKTDYEERYAIPDFLRQGSRSR